MDGIEEADNQTQMDDNMRSVVDEMPADDDGEGKERDGHKLETADKAIHLL